MSAPTRETLLGLCQQGDQAAWGRLYRANAGMVALFLRRLVGPNRDIDDLVQTVFVELFSSLSRYRGEYSLSTWLYGIASHVAARHLRLELRFRRRCAAYGEWLASADLLAPDAAKKAEARELLREVGEVVGGMRLKYRVVWVLREWEGLSSDETAAALGLPLGTVRSRLCRARQEVSEGLRARGLSSAAIASEEEVDISILPRIQPAGRR